MLRYCSIKDMVAQFTEATTTSNMVWLSVHVLAYYSVIFHRIVNYCGIDIFGALLLYKIITLSK